MTREVTPTPDPEETFDRLVDWDASLTPRDEFMDAVYGEEALRIKFGADITARTLHIGHAVNLRAMRVMQDMGHKVVYLSGGFTTLVGDPTDKLQARTTPEIADMEINKRRFVEQVGTILDTQDPNKFEERDNTEWWGGIEQRGTLQPLDMFRLLGTVTLNQLLARDMFRQRQQAGEPIQMSEFLYPVLQGYDSVMMESDITVVGTDQLFNEKMGRDFQERAGQRKQMILCTKITPGIDGGPKQSKSLGNYVGIAHSPVEKYATLMRLRDDLTDQWLQVYSDLPLARIEELKVDYAGDPIGLKKELAHNVTAMFHGTEAAQDAAEQFVRKMNRRMPEYVPNVYVPPGASVRNVLMQELGHKAGAVKQFLENGSVAWVEEVDDEGRYADTAFTEDTIKAAVDGNGTIRVGKRFYRLFTSAKFDNPDEPTTT